MKILRKIMIVFTFALSPLFLISCSKTKNAEIITSLYFQYDIVTNIVGDKMSVSLLTPLGSEIHDYEPSPKEIESIKNSKLFIYTSDTFEPWVSKVSSNNLNALNLHEYIEMELDHETSHHEHDDHTHDNHYWTDPIVFINLMNVVLNEVIAIDPESRDYYLTNANSYQEEILNVHTLFETLLETKNNPTIFFYGHNAMSAFGARYQINIVSLSESYQPDADVTLKQIEALKSKLVLANAHYLFIEELVDPKGAQSLKDNLRNEGYELTIYTLHGYHNISKNEFKEGVRYVDLFKQNYEYIKLALND